MSNIYNDEMDGCGSERMSKTCFIQLEEIFGVALAVVALHSYLLVCRTVN
jgi:hypothetical protein